MILKQAFANHWKFEGRDIDGTLLWVEEFDNLITTEGLIDILNKYLQGVAYSAAWFMGLVDNVGFGSLAETDTAGQITTSTPGMGTNGWAENVAYSQAARPTLSLGITTGSGSTATVDNTSSPAVYNMTSSAVINGAFLVNVSVKGSTAGKIYAEGSFSGPQTVPLGGTLTVTVTVTATSA